MIYAESHITLGNSDKLDRLAQLLAVSDVTAIGHLHCFWWWAMVNAPTGELTRYVADEIAKGSRWHGDPDYFFEALIEAEFVDADAEGFHIHDWFVYSGRVIAKREEQAKKMRSIRSQSKSDVTETSASKRDRTARTDNLISLARVKGRASARRRAALDVTGEHSSTNTSLRGGVRSLSNSSSTDERAAWQTRGHERTTHSPVPRVTRASDADERDARERFGVSRVERQLGAETVERFARRFEKKSIALDEIWLSYALVQASGKAPNITNGSAIQALTKAVETINTNASKTSITGLAAAVVVRAFEAEVELERRAEERAARKRRQGAANPEGTERSENGSDEGLGPADREAVLRHSLFGAGDNPSGDPVDDQRSDAVPRLRRPLPPRPGLPSV